MHFSQWTFLDVIFVVVILVSTGFAVTKGLAREIISLVALIGGLILAAFYYPWVAAFFSEFTRTEVLANLIGFTILFVGALIVGAVAALLVNRLVKMASLEWIDRVLGGLYGFLRGWAVSSIIILALIAFPVRPNAVARSYLAPYLLAGARAAVLLAPQELKTKFYEQYLKVLEEWNRSRKTA